MDTTDLSYKRPRTVQHPDVAEAVAFWGLKCQYRGIVLTGDLIRAKAQIFAGSMGVSEENISFSHGWAPQIPVTPQTASCPHSWREWLSRYERSGGGSSTPQGRGCCL